MPDQHAKLSPSAAKRWLTCPASALESARFVSPDTEHSLRGTAGHWAYAEDLMNGGPVQVGVKAPNGIEITAEILEQASFGVGWVRNYIKNEAKGPSVLYVEERVQIGTYFGLGEEWFWGTADTIILAPHELVVVDLKLGWQHVDAEENPQLMSYAVGVCHLLGWMWDYIRLVILQPRNGGAKEWVCSREALLQWAEENKPQVLAATKPGAEFVPNDECRWCPAAGACKKLQAEQMALAKQEFSDAPDAIEKWANSLSLDDLGLLLTKAKAIRGALAAAEEHARKLALLGTKVPGFKVVESRKNRVWKDEEKARSGLVLLGYKEDDIAPRKMCSPAQAEKLVGKKVLEEFIEKPKGEPVLAPEGDKRPEVAVDGFSAVDTGNLLD